jgi:hypothetical protein
MSLRRCMPNCSAVVGDVEALCMHGCGGPAVVGEAEAGILALQLVSPSLSVHPPCICNLCRCANRGPPCAHNTHHTHPPSLSSWMAF